MSMKLRGCTLMNRSKHKFSEAELRLFRQLKDFGYSPEVVYDIGASNGMWTKVVRQVFPEAKYELFEPLADKLPYYKEPQEAQLKEASNVRLHKIGLGDKNLNQEMAIYTGGFGSTFLEIERIKSIADRLKQQNRLDEIATFPVRRLDDYATELNLPAPNIVKMDTQGFELAILNGGNETLKKADILLLETWTYRGYGESTPLLHELMGPVAQLGFKLTDFGDIYWAPQHILTSIDAIFMRTGFLEEIEIKTDGWGWQIWD